MTTVDCDVAVIGGGFGGVAAAIALTDCGLKVVLTEEFPWIGGQVSSQALCVLDDLDHPSGERTGITRRYAAFRERTRAYYRYAYKLSPFGAAQLHLCAGNARCSHLTAEPQVAHRCLTEWLAPAVAAGRLTLLTGLTPTSARRSADSRCVESIVCLPTGAMSGSSTPATTEIRARFFLDATETGDTYPLLNLAYRLGAEAQSEFNEPHALPQADRSAIQCFTYCAMVEFVPGGNFTIAKPAGYETIRDAAGFHLSGPGSSPAEPSYFFRARTLKSGQRIVPFWYYRCVVDSANFEGVNGRACINVKSNDYHDAAYLEQPRRAEILVDARRLTAAYLYWLQTEAPRDEGGRGYPELRPMTEATGTTDGIAQAPYVREGRRLAARTTVIEQDLSVAFQTGARARHFADGVALGGYAIDIHARAGQDGPSIWQEARPYQVPLGALVTAELDNFAVAGKGIGVTQVANGAYRMHPSEWSIGEAAGELAAFCLAHDCSPPVAGPARIAFQRRLAERGMPVYWFEDLPFDHPAFVAAQLLAVSGVWPGTADHLRFDGDQSLGRHRAVFLQVMDRLATVGLDVELLRESCLNAQNGRKYDVVHQILALIDRQQGWPRILER